MKQLDYTATVHRHRSAGGDEWWVSSDLSRNFLVKFSGPSDVAKAMAIEYASMKFSKVEVSNE